MHYYDEWVLMNVVFTLAITGRHSDRPLRNLVINRRGGSPCPPTGCKYNVGCIKIFCEIMFWILC